MPKDQKRGSTRVGQHLGIVTSTLTPYTASRRLSKSFLCRVVDLLLLSIRVFDMCDNAADDDVAFSSHSQHDNHM